jgi:hypothetical protein
MEIGHNDIQTAMEPCSCTKYEVTTSPGSLGSKACCMVEVRKCENLKMLYGYGVRDVPPSLSETLWTNLAPEGGARRGLGTRAHYE